jgi:hypothetical protein
MLIWEMYEFSKHSGKPNTFHIICGNISNPADSLLHIAEKLLTDSESNFDEMGLNISDLNHFAAVSTRVKMATNAYYAVDNIPRNGFSAIDTQVCSALPCKPSY